ncbi:MAG: neuromedin U [Syntrophorhabdales bacterium]
MKRTTIGLVLSLALALVSMPLWAADDQTELAKNAQNPVAGDETELAKKAQNPVADLISIPIQPNFNFNYGANRNKSQIVTNIQPVVPISLNKDWNLITRTILPVVYTEYPAYQTGLSNLQFTGFLSPANSGKFMWGVGPVFQFPTTTDTYLGNKMWSAGPSAAGVFTSGHWVVGLLVQNVWSFAGPSGQSNPSVNQFLAQYFINYNLQKGWYITSSPIITANWKAAGPDQWTVPFGGGVGKIFKIGKLPFNANVQAFYNVERPGIGPDWSIRGQIALLLPKDIF